MNNDLNNLLSQEIEHLTNKKPHTKYKIEYISKYVEKWGYIVSESNADNINFIDCMCNAGIYADGDYCSATKVFLTFISMANKYPNKNYNIFLNDYNKDKIRIIKRVFSLLCPKIPSNLHVFFDIEDVNDYLSQLKSKKTFFDFPAKTILYVDPYSFHSVIINTLEDFLKTIYCELLFNLFTSDFSRNKNDKGIIRVLGGVYDINNVNELVEHIKSRLKVGKIAYFFSYQFRHSKNVELYQILFATPALAGLNTLKKILWNVFEGDVFYQTDVNKEKGQLSLFTSLDNKNMSAAYFAKEAQEKVVLAFKGREVDYSLIESFVIENTLLSSDHVLKYLIKPLINNQSIYKLNINSKQDFKRDRYLFKL